MGKIHLLLSDIMFTLFTLLCGRKDG